jgi:hypothetical protein
MTEPTPDPAYAYDGNGKLVKLTENGTPKNYYLISTLLNVTVADLTATGAMDKGYVVSPSGSRLASLKNNEVTFINNEPLSEDEYSFKTDKTNVGQRMFDPSGRTPGYPGYTGGGPCGSNCPGYFPPSNGGYGGEQAAHDLAYNQRWQDNVFWNLGAYIAAHIVVGSSNPPAGWDPNQRDTRPGVEWAQQVQTYGGFWVGGLFAGVTGFGQGRETTWRLGIVFAQEQQTQPPVKMTPEEVQRLWQGVDATVVGKCADFIKRLGEAVTGKEIYDTKLWLAEGLSRAAGSFGVYWTDSSFANFRDLQGSHPNDAGIGIERYKGSWPPDRRHELFPQWSDSSGNYLPFSVGVIHEIIHVAARADDQVLAKVVEGMGIKVYDDGREVDPPKPGEYGGKYWGAALKNHCDETATYFRAKRR